MPEYLTDCTEIRLFNDASISKMICVLTALTDASVYIALRPTIKRRAAYSVRLSTRSSIAYFKERGQRICRISNDDTSLCVDKVEPLEFIQSAVYARLYQVKSSQVFYCFQNETKIHNLCSTKQLKQ